MYRDRNPVVFTSDSKMAKMIELSELKEEPESGDEGDYVNQLE